MLANQKIKNKKPNHKKLFLIILTILFLLIAILSIIILSITSQIKLDKQLLTSFTNPIEIYDINNEKVTESLSGSSYAKLENLNQKTYQAFIDIEDKTFFEHNGINIKRMFKALATNIASGEIVQGASTISQQLIKNTHLSNEKTYSRKIKEVVLALELENEFEKDEILEMYLNAIYFGNGCYGIESASNFYFNKNASELSLNESAILAGIIKSPSYYDPINYPEHIRERKNLILSKMFELGNIEEKEFVSALNEEIALSLNISTQLSNQCYYTSAIDEASEILNMSPTMLASKGYKIFTYFDQEANQNLVKNTANETNALHNGIIVDNKTQGIIAFTSSLKYGSINLKRTPASTLKPILVYAPAIESGLIQPASLLNDERTTFDENYSPKNINNMYYGKISASDALAKSLNVPAVKLLEQIGIENAKKFATNFGIDFDSADNGLSLALGSMKYGITIKNLIDAYSPFSHAGKFASSTFIREIRDKNNNIIYSHKPIKRQIISPESAFLVGDMLQNTTKNGTCTAMKNLGFEIQAKSGTNGAENSNKNTGAICIAQTSAHSACIWFFSKDYKTENLLENSTISGLSPTIRLKNMFETLYAKEKPARFEIPQGIKKIELDLLDYKANKLTIANQNTPKSFKFNAFFNESFMPLDASSNFLTLTTPVLSFKQHDNSIEFSFQSLISQEYELIHEEYENGKIISSTSVAKIFNSNQNEVITLNVNLDKEHKFFLNTNFVSKSEYSTSNIVVILPKQTQNNAFWFTIW